MQFAAMIVFGASLFFILVLFTVKRMEVGRERRFVETLRTKADSGALWVKRLLLAIEDHTRHTPFFLGALVRWSVHVGALSFARLARKSAEYAHRIADLVSHKHRFERRETRSQYLKMVGERPTPSVPETMQPAAPEYVPPQPESRPQYSYAPPTDAQQLAHEAKKSSGRRGKKKDGEVAIL